MDGIFGTLTVFMFVTLPDGREKRATLAKIPCEYVKREEKFLAFKRANPNLSEDINLGAKFDFSEWVCLY